MSCSWVTWQPTGSPTGRSTSIPLRGPRLSAGAGPRQPARLALGVLQRARHRPAPGTHARHGAAPSRCRGVRTLLAELNRALSHLAFLGTFPVDWPRRQSSAGSRGVRRCKGSGGDLRWSRPLDAQPGRWAPRGDPRGLDRSRPPFRRHRPRALASSRTTLLADHASSLPPTAWRSVDARPCRAVRPVRGRRPRERVRPGPPARRAVPRLWPARR